MPFSKIHVKWRSSLNPRIALPVAGAVAVGVFLSAASNALNWTDATSLVVGCAMAAMLGLFGVPLMLLPVATEDREVLSLDHELATGGLENHFSRPTLAVAAGRREKQLGIRSTPVELGVAGFRKGSDARYHANALDDALPTSFVVLRQEEAKNANRRSSREQVIIAIPSRSELTRAGEVRSPSADIVDIRNLFIDVPEQNHLGMQEHWLQRRTMSTSSRN